jgi:hypothetical protein
VTATAASIIADWRAAHQSPAALAEAAETHPLPQPGAVGRKRNRGYNVNSKTLGGNQADYLARRLARDRHKG